MSDEVAANDEDDGEFHSPFDLGFGHGALETFKWLIVGHLLYVVGLIVAMALEIDRGNIWVTPLFGLPLLWAERKHRPWLRALVFVVGFTAAHWLAVRFAVESAGGDAMMTPGLVGGAVGAAISLVACAVLGLFRPGVPTLVLAACGIVLLAATGSFGVYMYLNSSGGTGGFTSEILRMLWIYTLWQVVFAYVLAKTLRPVRA
ncbi:MAG: hypothetical protein V4574_16750 [Pseudomonadota bacterium]